MVPKLLAIALATAPTCGPEPIATSDPIAPIEGELAYGRLGPHGRFEPYAVDSASERVLVTVELGFQGAWMIAMVAALPPEYVGQRVDFTCVIETATWSSDRGELLEDVLVDADGLLHAPFMILSWWTQEPTDAEVRCEVHGSTRADVTRVDATLVPAGAGP